MTSLLGRNPIAVAVIGAALLVIGLTTHSLLMPWIGGALLVIGGARAASRLNGRGLDRGSSSRRSMR